MATVPMVGVDDQVSNLQADSRVKSVGTHIVAFRSLIIIILHLRTRA